jgi:hypothetical protein
MRKAWRTMLIMTAALLVLGLVLCAVSFFTGGSVSRILDTTDVEDYTKYIDMDQIEAIWSLLR